MKLHKSKLKTLLTVETTEKLCAESNIRLTLVQTYDDFLYRSIFMSPQLTMSGDAQLMPQGVFKIMTRSNKTFFVLEYF